MHADLAFPILSMLVVVPSSARCSSRCSSRRRRSTSARRRIAAVATGAMSIWLTVEFDRADDGFQFVSKHPWIEQWGIRGTSVSTASRCSSCC